MPALCVPALRLRPDLPLLGDVSYRPLRPGRTRNYYLTLLFAHPLSTFSQSLEPLWHNTSYALISSYRALITQTESALPPLTAGGRKAKPTTPAHIELRKILTRFRQALASEETFYRGLASRLVGFYNLQNLTKLHLAECGIGVGEEGGDGKAPDLGVGEKREKVALVYKCLICLGDLERYKEQYSDKIRREREGGKMHQGEERYTRAKMYYEVARALVPDDGELRIDLSRHDAS